MYKASRLNLRKKLNRMVRFQKQAAGEPIPTLLFKKQDKKVAVLFPYESIYSIAQDEGFGLTGTCEGNGDCGLCVISIHSGAESLTPMNKEEKDILEKLGHPDGTRLSCQSRPTGDVTVDFIDY
ncbi:MAG: 2Fe-2S iron-sulfur cluster-binding protein, partial [Nitrospinales bacterium]